MTKKRRLDRTWSQMMLMPYVLAFPKIDSQLRIQMQMVYFKKWSGNSNDEVGKWEWEEEEITRVNFPITLGNWSSVSLGNSEIVVNTFLGYFAPKGWRDLRVLYQSSVIPHGLELLTPLDISAFPCAPANMALATSKKILKEKRWRD